MSARQVRYSGRLNNRQSYARPVTNRPRRRLPKLSVWQRRLAILFVVALIVFVGLEQIFAIRTITVQPLARQGTVGPEVRQVLEQHLGQGNLLLLSPTELTQNLLATDPTIKADRRQESHCDIVQIWPFR